MEHVYSAGIIVYRTINDIPEYLLLQYGAGHWDFAKGKMESGETKEQAALRELQEETGLSAHREPDFEESFSYIFHNYDKKLAQKTVYFFVGPATTTDVTLSDEHIDYAWLPYKEALEQLTYDNAKKVLKKAHKYISALQQKS
jgi:8-oxo-dGTP pyrophosphatase MutT (NUDIX family)